VTLHRKVAMSLFLVIFIAFAFAIILGAFASRY
jgi:hypothetical protein